MRVVGLDLSLSCTGVARITTGGPTTVGLAGPDLASRLQYLTEVRRVVSKPAKDPTTATRSTRLRRLAGDVTALCAGADLVTVEGPSFASSGAGTWDRAGYWWLVVARLTGAGLNVVEVPPSNLKTYATGKGNAGKDDVLTHVIRRYPCVTFAGNDEADALVLAAMGARFAGFPIETDLPKTHTRAMTSVRWQPTT